MAATTHNLTSALSTGDGRQKVGDLATQVPETGTGRSVALVGVLTETVAVAAFTDGGATVGTFQLIGEVPAGAVLLGSKVVVSAGFAGDTTAALTIGDGSDVDRYNTSTIDVFSTAASGVQSGVPSGNKLITTANRPTLTITSTADFTSVVSNGSGVLTVSLYYLQTA